MRALALLVCAAILAGCSKPEDRSAASGTLGDTLTTDEVPAGGTVSLGDFAGTWKMHSTDDQGRNPVDTELRATGDTSGWTMKGPDGKTHSVRVVALGGDSLVAESGPRPSYVVKGAMVTTRTVYRLEGNKLVGQTEARMKIGGRDSVAQRTVEGTRAP
jgi:hypothetical protein